ncbi:ABC transporter substrate-binding protein [Brachybacterium alimentarium]|uniref:ABC transporter substrate-binding protein n=1 Tax=Brachybacterium alimentarium TaxID=47845 RepID=UPI003FD167C3
MTTPRRSPRATCALLVLALLALVGCTASDGDWPVDHDLAVLCSNDAEICRAWTRTFSERTGYDVTTVRLPTSEALERIRHGEDLPEFDVWHGGGSEMYVEAADEGLLASYRSGESEGIPAAFQDTENRWSGVYSSMLAFCVAPQAVAELGTDIPHTWDDLLDPALKGQISTASPRTSGTAYTAMSLQIDRLGADAGRGYLADLYGQVLQFTRSGTAPAQVVARGEAAVAITFAPYCDAARADGSQVDVVLPDDATEYEVGAVAVLADAPHPEAARDYLDFALSADGQQAGTTSGIEQIPTRSDLPDNLAEILADGSYPVIGASLTERSARRDALLAWFSEEVER